MRKITLTAPLVGMYFWPPAPLIVRYLPAGTELFLVRESENPVDHNSIGVFVRSSAIPKSQYPMLRAELPADFWTFDELLMRGTLQPQTMPQPSDDVEPWIFLGFVAQSRNDDLPEFMLKDRAWASYVAKHHGKRCIGNLEIAAAMRSPWWSARLDFDFEGKPLVSVTCDEGDQS